MSPEEIRAVLEQIGASRVVQPDHAARGVHVDALVAPEHLRAAATALRERWFLIDHVTAVDAAPQMLLVYHFSHPEGGCRAALKLLTDRNDPRAPTISDIYPGANWHERETHDFYGVVFEGHPDLSPLILPEDAGDLRPLRKEEGSLKSLAELIPEFGPPPGAQDGEKPAKPRPKAEKAGEEGA
ncbi:MAG: NADH-quinone oxidoreductase subunit C [Deferrisomatales bacterium]|nr:NADH-quinone oxidoreductase subunit C [Deferrisomatales bacterium]